MSVVLVMHDHPGHAYQMHPIYRGLKDSSVIKHREETSLIQSPRPCWVSPPQTLLPPDNILLNYRAISTHE